MKSGRVTTLSRAVLKRDRFLPVDQRIGGALRAVGLPAGLVRGATYGVSGVSPVSFTASLVVEASRAGGWVAWCAPTAPNVRALHDAGWGLDRLVCIDPANRWIDCADACVGGFEILVVALPTHLPARDVRRLSGVAARSNGIVVAIGNPLHRALSADVEFRVEHSEWSAVGAGHLQRHDMHVNLAGRRVVESQRFTVTLGSSS